jgi:phosphatidylethanolamine/phosphatidyl-N-methylethanolamine N-methyltransferase
VELKQVERIYTAYAGIYDRIFGRMLQEQRGAAIRGLQPRPGERILEVGVGTGLTLEHYPASCEVTGIDLSSGMLEKARARVGELGLDHVRLALMDAGNMTFDDDSFDTVVAAYVVTAVPDHQQLMSEMVRVCRSGGRIIMLNHFSNGNPILGAIERKISPLCEHIGFRTDLTVQHVLDGFPLEVDRHRRVKPFGIWHLVECWNRKEAIATSGSA